MDPVPGQACGGAALTCLGSTAISRAVCPSWDVSMASLLTPALPPVRSSGMTSLDPSVLTFTLLPGSRGTEML